jgi:hypothetical protein
MMILALVRNYIPSYQWVVQGGWNIADCVSRSYDLERMVVGTVGAGRIGSAVLRRLKAFDVQLHYTDRHRLSPDVERDLGLTFHKDAASLVRVCDVVTINTPLHPETEHLFNDALIATMKRGAYLVNTARGKICDRDAVARALKSGQLAGYAGDVSLAVDAASWHDAARLGNEPLRPGPLRRGRPGDPRVLVRGPSNPRRVPHRFRRRTGGSGRALVQCGERDGGIRRGRAVPEVARIDSTISSTSRMIVMRRLGRNDPRVANRFRSSSEAAERTKPVGDNSGTTIGSRNLTLALRHAMLPVLRLPGRLRNLRC